MVVQGQPKDDLEEVLMSNNTGNMKRKKERVEGTPRTDLQYEQLGERLNSLSKRLASDRDKWDGRTTEVYYLCFKDETFAERGDFFKTVHINPPREARLPENTETAEKKPRRLRTFKRIKKGDGNDK